MRAWRRTATLSGGSSGAVVALDSAERRAGAQAAAGHEGPSGRPRAPLGARPSLAGRATTQRSSEPSSISNGRSLSDARIETSCGTATGADDARAATRSIATRERSIASGARIVRGGFDPKAVLARAHMFGPDITKGSREKQTPQRARNERHAPRVPLTTWPSPRRTRRVREGARSRAVVRSGARPDRSRRDGPSPSSRRRSRAASRATTSSLAPMLEWWRSRAGCWDNGRTDSIRSRRRRRRRASSRRARDGARAHRPSSRRARGGARPGHGPPRRGPTGRRRGRRGVPRRRRRAAPRAPPDRGSEVRRARPRPADGRTRRRPAPRRSKELVAV